MAEWRKEYLDAAETKTKKRILAFDHRIYLLTSGSQGEGKVMTIT